ncbi:uncharacterized protein LOC132745613 [Ruditapes philippinarum]|uniref:uncharacterized protein LOC132745613 n=1 Tax=Ruditapes philippinarum TaxID=129788 RepID=UPI00295A57B0|nr:uncharacterized protein LOC132745613 [Ruditapes philippinarum]
MIYGYIIYKTETNGDVSQCGGRTPAVRICKHSEVTMVTKVFIETADVPPRQINRCKCNVTPALLNSSVSLFYRKISRESKNVYFKFQDILLNKTEERANSTFTKENELVLETTSDFNMKDVCLIISADDESTFNISCDESQWAVTQSTVPEITISELETSINSTLENSSDICTIGIATGGIVCVIVELVAILIICYKRGAYKQKKNVRTPKLSQGENETSARNDGGDNDYYMTENPLYNMTEPMMDKNESPLYLLVQKHAPNDEQRMEAYDDNPDLPNNSSQPLAFQQS